MKKEKLSYKDRVMKRFAEKQLARQGMFQHEDNASNDENKNEELKKDTDGKDTDNTEK